ncbi:XPG I-region family protein [Candida albicans]|uniref:XPG I-region family protein n=1 Tax=Candida albicans TaxID=5476 RepID=A0A8H6C215_CANAX|nr:XPG I-region family protein [Candida albicans]
MILSHLRLKSRLRMGYRKEQLEELFPNSMDFSKFQIQQVQRRNFYTQKLMDVTGMGADATISKRLAGDKDRKYALVKNEDGWTLALEGNSEDNPIQVDSDEAEDITREVNSYKEDLRKDKKDEDSDSDFEDVPLEEIPETEEDKDYQRALIKSIYEQYNTQENMQAPTSTINGVDDDELRKAVEKSKVDYFELQAKETQQLEEEKFDFGSSMLFSTNAVKEEALQNSEEISNLTEHAHTQANTVHLSQSFLFNADPHRTEPTKDQQKLPDWFQSEVNKTLNPHNVKFVNYNDYQIRNQKNQEEKDAGLVPWYEAKEILEQEQSDEEEQEQEQEKPDNDSDEMRKSESVPPSSVEDIRKPAVMDYQFEEEDEEELVQQLQKEELDHESLKHQIKASHAIPLTSLETRITDEQLLQEKFQKAKRDSDEVTETMINDVQELLKRFGIPYITAPMEAEAQCAELYKIGLVDGIVTDDSDCFLFGGDKIYKNMFDQKQYVEFYLQDDLFNKMALTQHKLIELALLLGSDYTEGIKGIGPVQAMEILAEFGNLEKFKEWFDKHTKSVADKTELTKLQKSLLDRIKKGKLYLPDSFPDKVVEQAYMSPEVDSDKTEFQWGVPDLDQIRSFLMYNLSWTQTEVDEVMVPLVQDMNKKKLEGRQSTISEFFPQEYIQSRKELNLGKRLKTAANKLKKQKHL